MKQIYNLRGSNGRSLVTNLLNVSQRWKCARVSPIFKDGDHSDMHKLLSVLPSLSKVLERHVFDALHNYLMTNALISQQQSGFRKHQLIKITDSLLQSMDEGKISGFVMIDLRKAFDLVDHPTLLQKLCLYGMADNPMSWFTSYLTDYLKLSLTIDFLPRPP